MKHSVKTTKEKFTAGIKTLLQTLGVSNPMAVPRLEKVVISAGVGSKSDKRKRELVYDRLSHITGQRAVWRGARKSIASFKVREGDPVGVCVTLRGRRMYAFLDRLIHVVFPRTRDFQGVDPKSIDEMGNITIGIPEHTVFPETGDEDLRDIFGLSITIVTTAQDRSGARALLNAIGLPFRESDI